MKIFAENVSYNPKHFVEVTVDEKNFTTVITLVTGKTLRIKAKSLFEARAIMLFFMYSFMCREDTVF